MRQAGTYKKYGRMVAVLLVGLFVFSCDEAAVDAVDQEQSSQPEEVSPMTMKNDADPKDETLSPVVSEETSVVSEFLSDLDVSGRTEIQKVISPGGIEAWLVEEHAVPLIAVEVGFKGGARHDPQGKEGLAYLLSGLLDEGAGEFDSQAFQTRLEDKAIRLSFDAGRDGFYGSMRTLSERKNDAFDMLRLALTSPRFDEEPVERIRSQILVRLKRDAGNPRVIAQQRWFAETFGDHAYGRLVRGTAESVAAIGVEDLRQYVSSALARDTMRVAVVGDIDAATLGPLLDSTFGALPAQSSAEMIERADISSEGKLVVIERDQPQSITVFGGPGLDLNDPDFFPAYVMNYILGGGGFASRLMEEVREKRGLAYGVSTGLLPMDYAGAFYGSVATDNNRIAESIQIIKSELARMRDEGVSATELEGAKTYLTGSFPLRFDTNSKIANQLVGYQLVGRPIDYINTRNAQIEAVTQEDIARAAQRFLSPEAMTFVVVGKPTGLEE